jgi:hypothetical protein
LKVGVGATIRDGHWDRITRNEEFVSSRLPKIREEVFHIDYLR